MANGSHAEIKFKIICPMCGNKIILAMEPNDQFVGYCENCERKIKMTYGPFGIMDGTIDIVLR